jgi:hypothetical protein
MFLVWIATNKHQIEKIGEQTHVSFPGSHRGFKVSDESYLLSL